jgi:hypothetical protein
LNGIEVEAAVNNGIVVGQGPSGAAATGISIQGASRYGLVVGSNQTPATIPVLAPIDPAVAAILLTSQGNTAAADSNRLQFQDRLASANHTWTMQTVSTNLNFVRDGAAAAAAASALSLSPTGINGNSGGLKHHRFSSLSGTCPTAAKVGAACTSAALSWPTAFADANYTVSCTLSSPTGQPHIVAYGSKRPGSFTLTIAADTASAANAGADCIAIHD